MNIQQLWFAILFTYIGCINFTNSQHNHDHRHHLQEQAPTDATFSKRYHRLLHSHSPFGILSKYFLRNRAQNEGHVRRKRQITPSIQQLLKLSELQQQQQSQLDKQNQHAQRILYNEANVRLRRQPQVYSNGFSSYPRYFQQLPVNYYQSALNQATENGKWANSPTLAQYSNNYGFYGKPQALNNYYKKKEEYYRGYGVGKRHQYQQFKPYSSFENTPRSNRIDKRQDVIRQRKNASSTRPPKRKFRPSNVQS